MEPDLFLYFQKALQLGDGFLGITRKEQYAIILIRMIVRSGTAGNVITGSLFVHYF